MKTGVKRISCLVSVTLLLASAVTFAQQPPAGQKIGLAANVLRSYNAIKTNLTQEADKMSEANYDFRPVPEIRSFGQLFAHVANAQYGTCSAVKGVPNPNQGKNLEQVLKTKAEFVKALADSFAFCDDAYGALTDETALQTIKRGQNEVTRAGALFDNIGHNEEMYGIGTVYLRLKGIVPPSTEAEAARRKSTAR